jgi:hypothetical protein
MTDELTITDVAKLIGKCERETRPTHDRDASEKAEMLIRVLAMFEPKSLEEAAILIGFARSVVRAMVIEGVATAAAIRDVAAVSDRMLWSTFRYLVDATGLDVAGYGLGRVLTPDDMRRLGLYLGSDPDVRPVPSGKVAPPPRDDDIRSLILASIEPRSGAA